MSVLSKEPASIAKVLDASFKVLKVSFPKIIGFGILAGIVTAALNILGILIIQEMDGSEMTGLMVFFIVFLLELLTLNGLFGAIIYRVDNVCNLRNDSFSEAMAVGLRKLPAMVLATFLYIFVVILGSVLLIIPGLILMLSLFFYAYFIILEDQSAYQSLKASHKLVWKDWWRTMGVFTVPSILIFIFYFAFGMLMVYTDINENEINTAEVLMNLFTGVFYLYFYVLCYVQCHDLKLRKSGSDLEARMVEQ